VVLPIADRHRDYAASVRQALDDSGLRAELDDRNEKIGAKIRDAQLRKVPYMLVAGDRESQAGTVAVRSRREGDLGPMAIDAIRGLMLRMQTDRTLGP
jgi:threonyl-tRNA synthetase